MAEEAKMTEEEKMDPARIAKVIRDAARAGGIMLKGPDKNCKKCGGRGWIGVRADNGDPIVCRCCFFKEDLAKQDAMPAEYIRPLNRAQRRAKKRG